MTDVAKLFPLYSELYSLIKDEEETHMNWSIASSKINALSTEKMELIYALILCYFIKENHVIPDKKRFVPYKGKLMDGNHGVLFHINQIPIRLQMILSKFLEYV
jgi:hypothetical protein